VLDQQIAEFCLEVQSWIFVEHFLNHLRWHLIKAKAQQLEARAKVDQRDLGSHPSRDAWRSVQGDRLPNQIGALVCLRERLENESDWSNRLNQPNLSARLSCWFRPWLW
jgi:hypothetical protein